VAGDEINYRRFFDINDLAGLRMEDEHVFHETHNFILDLIATGKVDGLRVDHPDGLYDPLQYFSRLQAAAVGKMQKLTNGEQNNSEGGDQMPLYVVAEKILADFESLPEIWSVNGTTGYDFSNHLNGILIDTEAEKPMTSLYHQFVGKQFDMESILYNSKKLIIRSSMAGELNVLASQLYCLAQVDRATRDFTYNRLRDGLIEVVAAFPVYRTYVNPEAMSKSDIKFIEWAVAKARSRKQSDDLSAFDFIKTILLSKERSNTASQVGRQSFISNFQQYTGPVMAKGLEDTSFYIYNRLLSLNEVGGSPKRFGISVTAFHHSNQDRLRYWPHGMLNSSTHDSKRSEDVRSRINVLTEMVPEWKRRLFKWSKLNRPLKTSLEEVLAPDKNDEYAFYQNLIGVWPTEPLDEIGMEEFLQRIINASVKACREAKVHTSWINQNQSYEDSVARFVEGVLIKDDSPFMTDFLEMHKNISWFGLLSSLSQVFLKLVSPGIPDIYQGCELLRLSLVDPDNRRPVDFQKRQDLLFSLLERMEKASEQAPLQQDLLADLHNGMAKMYIIVKTLRLRNSWQDVFDRGSYLPLEVTGAKSNHVCAFARKIEQRMIIGVAPRLYMTLMHGEKQHPIGTSVWGNTAIILPDALCDRRFTDIFSSDPANIIGVEKGSTSIEVARLLQSWPVALLQTSGR
jgi:(1->4)-alpha-D-glucan 1-alpha-D-glucosylmutase